MGCGISLIHRVSDEDTTVKNPVSRKTKVRQTKVTTFRAGQKGKLKRQNGRVGAAHVATKSSSNNTLITLPEESCVEEFKNGPGFKFFQEFPTPTLLKEAQLAYHRCGYDVPAGQGLKKPPFPVHNWKHDIFKMANFTNIDQHAINMPSNACIDTLEEVVEDLLKPTSDSLGAVRAIFRWIAAHDINALPFDGTEVPTTAAYYFHRIKKGLGGYAELFQKMCQLAGVNCVLIPGFVKGVGYQPGEEPTEHGGVWSAVFINDCWRLVDCQWGSSHVSIDGPGVSSASAGKRQDSATSEPQGSMSYAYEEFYFLTDPHHLIYSHFPYDDRWQLLARPLNLEEFQKMAYLKPGFFDLGFDLDSHPRCVLVAENGHCTFSLKLAQSGQRRFVYKLYLLQRNGVVSQTNDSFLENFVFLEILKDISTVRVNIHFPFTGKYRFKLFSKDASDPSGEFTSICSYVIYCDEAVKFEPYPNNPRHEWGLGADTDALGIELISHKYGRIETEMGEAELRFRLHKDVEFLHKLIRKGDPEATYKQFAFHRRENDHVIFKVRLPRLGKFMLSLYAKEVQAQGNFPNVCNFLVECDEPAEDTSPFPAVYNGRVGPNDNFRQLKMATIGENDSGCFSCNESGELVIRFEAPESVCLMPKLCLQVGDEYKELDEYAICIKNSDSGTTAVHLQFPEAGQYQFILYGKDPSSSSSGYPPVYYGVIQADFPKVGALPFPRVFSNWKDNFRLLEPTSGFLPTNSTVRFLVDIPESQGVAVIGSTWNHLHRNKQGLWDGNLDTGDNECDLKLSACLTKGSSKYSCLQLFKVVSDKTLKDMAEKQKTSYKACQLKLKERQEKRDAIDLSKGRISQETVEHRKRLEEERKQIQLRREEELKKVKNEAILMKVAEQLQRQKTDDDSKNLADLSGAHMSSNSEAGFVQIGGSNMDVGSYNGGGVMTDGVWNPEVHINGVPVNGIHLGGSQGDSQIGGVCSDGTQAAGVNMAGANGHVGGAQVGGVMVGGGQIGYTMIDGVPVACAMAGGVAQLPVGGDMVHGAQVGADQLGGAMAGGAVIGAAQLGGVLAGGDMVHGAQVGADQLGGAMVGGVAQLPSGGDMVHGTQVGADQLGGAMVGGALIGAARVNGVPVGGSMVSGVHISGDQTGVSQDVAFSAKNVGGLPYAISHNGGVQVAGSNISEDGTMAPAQQVDVQKLEEDAKDAERQAALLELAMVDAKKMAEAAELEKQKEIAEAMRTKAAQDKLQAAVQKQDRIFLEQVIKEYRARKIVSVNNELEDAQRLLDKLALKETLLKAMEAKDMAALRRIMSHIEDKALTGDLSVELAKGREKLKILERLSKLKSSILSMDAATMTELRRYNNPPEMVHQVIRATLLLLGEHEGITKTWKNCQKRCNPTGPDGLKRRVVDFDVDQLHPEIAARAVQILEEVELDDVRLISSGAATFFVWVKGIVGEVAGRRSEDSPPVTPANKFRQKQIFLGRGNIPDDDGDRPISRASTVRPGTSKVTRPSTTRSVRRPSITAR